MTMCNDGMGPLTLLSQLILVLMGFVLQLVCCHLVYFLVCFLIETPLRVGLMLAEKLCDRGMLMRVVVMMVVVVVVVVVVVASSNRHILY